MKLKNIIYFAITTLALGSCKKEFTPALPQGGSSAAVNFLGLSETFLSYNTINGSFGGIGIFMDTIENSSGQINSVTNSNLPYFQFAGDIKLSTFPFLRNSDNTTPIYLDYKSGSHRYIFSYMVPSAVGTPVNKPLLRLADTILTMGADSHSLIYFADAPAAEGAKVAYKLVRTDQPRENAVVRDKVVVRFINLGSDAGKLRITQLKPDGSEVTLGLPQELAFGNVSELIALDPANASSKQLVFNIYNTQGGKPMMVSGVPANAGRSFEVVIHGFTAAHQRQVVTAINPDNSLQYKTVTLPVSITATVRQTY